MNAAPPPASKDRPSSERGIILGGAIVACAALAAYSNSFHVPFVFDDIFSIEDNATLHSLRQSWSPPQDNGSITVAGRPWLNFTLALNYGISGLDVWSYHALNLVIHILAGLTLFGLVRRTLVQPRLVARFAGNSSSLALVIAVLWTLHPLQTEAVTYTIQRAESLMGLFFLVTLYGFVRSMASPRPRLWWSVSVTACLLGVATKEIAALAPVMVFLYDRTFISGRFHEAWRRHRWQHLSLAATWLPLFWLLAGTGGDRGGSFQFADSAMWVGHGLTQFEAVTRYVGLSFWPHPLVFDYGLIAPPRLGAALPWALPVLGLVAATLVALWRWPAFGFLGAWFFVILAPTSILPATLQIIVEHRMYLPLAAVITLVVTGSYLWIGRRVIVVFLALAVGAGWLTVQRNEVYRSELGLWSDTLVKRPDNARAYDSLGSLWIDRGNLVEAERCFTEALRRQPDFPMAHYNLGIVLQRTGRNEAAVGRFLTAIRLEPKFVNAHVNAGIALLKLGQSAVAIEHFEVALRLQPESADVHYNLGLALGQQGRPDDAIRQYQLALRLDPELAQAHFRLAEAQAAQGNVVAAERGLREAIRLQPVQAEAHFGLGNLLAGMNRFSEAIGEYQSALQGDPGSLPVRANLGNALLVAGRIDEAIVQYEQILRMQPDSPGIVENLNQARAMKQSSLPKP